MEPNDLEGLVDQTTRTHFRAVVTHAIDKIAEEIARETLSDPEFRESLRALVRERSRAIMASVLRTRGEP
jgi:hypothetical protein